MTNLNLKVAGAAAGALIGIAIAAFGWLDAIMIAVFAGIGLAAGMYASGQMGVLDEVMGRFFDRRRGKE